MENKNPVFSDCLGKYINFSTKEINDETLLNLKNEIDSNIESIENN